MFSRRRVYFAPAARRDIAAITLYSARNWGKTQAARYCREIEVAIERIAELPGVGSRRLDLPPDCRATAIGSHMIVYRTVTNEIEIVRVLHQRMNRQDHL